MAATRTPGRHDPRPLQAQPRIASDPSLSQQPLKAAQRRCRRTGVRERIPGDWKMLEESAPHAQGNASIAVWKLTVPAEGETVPTYWVRVRS